jgi:hypothetical protein
MLLVRTRKQPRTSQQRRSAADEDRGEPGQIAFHRSNRGQTTFFDKPFFGIYAEPQRKTWSVPYYSTGL